MVSLKQMYSKLKSVSRSHTSNTKESKDELQETRAIFNNSLGTINSEASISNVAISQRNSLAQSVAKSTHTVPKLKSNTEQQSNNATSTAVMDTQPPCYSKVSPGMLQCVIEQHKLIENHRIVHNGTISQASGNYTTHPARYYDNAHSYNSKVYQNYANLPDNTIHEQSYNRYTEYARKPVQYIDNKKIKREICNQLGLTHHKNSNLEYNKNLNLL